MNPLNPSTRLLPVLIYILPALADMVVAQFVFINAVRLARMGLSATVVAGTITLWSLVYLLTCPVVGRWVTPANAGKLIVMAMALITGICLLFPVMPGVHGIYALMALAGIGNALFFVPFQIFMKSVDGRSNKSIAYSTGLYTFSWSLGFASGPFVSGLLMELGTAERPGWIYACWFAAGISALTGLGGYLLEHLIVAAPGQTPEPPPPATAPVVDYTGKPDLAWLGWLCAGTGILVLAFIRGIFPSRAEGALHLSQSFQGTLFFLLSLAQGLTGLCLCRSRYWMYRKSGMLALGVAGIAGALALGLATNPLLLALGALLFGLYAGGFFFYLVFFALIHPRRSSQYVAINEMVVGTASLLGAMLGGWVADGFGFGTVYVVGGLLIMLSMGVQGMVLGNPKEN